MGVRGRGRVRQVTLVHAESEDEVSKTMLAMGYATAVARTRDRRLYSVSAHRIALHTYYDLYREGHVGVNSHCAKSL